jgi:hypothetical protein
MDKYVPALIILDKAKTLLFIEPFYFTFCQSFLPSFLDFSSSSVANSTNKKTTPSLHTQ